MDIKEIGKALAKLGLPLLGTALGGPGGAAIGSALAQAIGSENNSPEAILAHLGQDADAIQKAREFELKHQEVLLRLSIEASQEVTKRWQSDMSSDNWLSKNIRPVTLISILSVYAVFALMSAFGKQVSESYIDLLGQFGMIVFGAYFVGRSVEKATQIKAK